MAKKKSDCCSVTHHPSHAKELPGINRVSGQIEGIKKMIEEQRYCPDILTQLRAIRSAINSIEASILETHLDACVTDVLNTKNKDETQKKITELKEIYRRFNNG